MCIRDRSTVSPWSSPGSCPGNRSWARSRQGTMAASTAPLSRRLSGLLSMIPTTIAVSGRSRNTRSTVPRTPGPGTTPAHAPHWAVSTGSGLSMPSQATGAPLNRSSRYLRTKAKADSPSAITATGRTSPQSGLNCSQRSSKKSSPSQAGPRKSSVTFRFGSSGRRTASTTPRVQPSAPLTEWSTTMSPASPGAADSPKTRHRNSVIRKVIKIEKSAGNRSEAIGNLLIIRLVVDHFVAAGVLGRVQGRVGRPDQPGHVPSGTPLGHPGRDGEANGLVGQLALCARPEVVLLHFHADGFSAEPGNGPGHPLHDHHQLLSPVPGGKGLVLHGMGGDDPGQDLEQVIAGLVAVGVVYLLEEVHVDHDQGEGERLLGLGLHHLLEIPVQGTAVVQRGQQRIEIGRMLQLPRPVLQLARLLAEFGDQLLKNVPDLGDDERTLLAGGDDINGLFLEVVQLPPLPLAAALQGDDDRVHLVEELNRRPLFLGQGLFHLHGADGLHDEHVKHADHVLKLFFGKVLLGQFAEHLFLDFELFFIRVDGEMPQEVAHEKDDRQPIRVVPDAEFVHDVGNAFQLVDSLPCFHFFPPYSLETTSQNGVCLLEYRGRDAGGQSFSAGNVSARTQIMSAPLSTATKRLNTFMSRASRMSWRMSVSASQGSMASAQGRSVVRASYTSDMEMMRTGMGMLSPLSPAGQPVPSSFSWWKRMQLMVFWVMGRWAHMDTPCTGCSLITARSPVVSEPRLFRIRRGILALPTSCSSAPRAHSNISLSVMSQVWNTATEQMKTCMQWVYVLQSWEMKGATVDRDSSEARNLMELLTISAMRLKCLARSVVGSLRSNTSCMTTADASQKTLDRSLMGRVSSSRMVPRLRSMYCSY
eukprot:TRINITY_DN3387_c0_g1_i2.p1 TRINITY_DN3387_c0_g1~~TRINITY_DN3387_c0_g1_i2.p1  ORF type:complete len:907 (-),score=229.04 TRINITY_DN3387_c0_g1_i2:352-2967(-)